MGRPRGLKPPSPICPPRSNRRHSFRYGQAKVSVWGKCIEVNCPVLKIVPRTLAPYVKVLWVRSELVYFLMIVVVFPPSIVAKMADARTQRVAWGTGLGNDLGWMQYKRYSLIFSQVDRRTEGQGVTAMELRKSIALQIQCVVLLLLGFLFYAILLAHKHQTLRNLSLVKLRGTWDRAQ